MSKGIVLSILASCLFGVLYYFTSLLRPLDGQEIFGWRILISLPFMTLFLCLYGEWKWVALIFPALARPACIDPLRHVDQFSGGGTTVDVYVGAFERSWARCFIGRYFLLPLTMILTGRIVYGEHLSHLQKIATALAVLVWPRTVPHGWFLLDHVGGLGLPDVLCTAQKNRYR